MKTTICLLRNGNGMDLNRYVARVFPTPITAYKWASRQSRNVSIVHLPGSWKVGQCVPLGVKGQTF